MEHTIKVNEDETHRSLVSKGSIPHQYRRDRILAPVEYIPASSVEVQTEKKPIRSCCFLIDSHAMAYIGQMTVTIIVLGISSYFLYEANGNCEQSSPWIGLISFVLAKILTTVVSSV
jgi:hypothetical protein